MTPRAKRFGGASTRRRPTVLVAAGWLLLLLAALSLVTLRQTRGLEAERALRAFETERGIAEAERVGAARRVDELRSRARIVRVASERLGLHLPDDREIVLLPASAP